MSTILLLSILLAGGLSLNPPKCNYLSSTEYEAYMKRKNSKWERTDRLVLEFHDKVLLTEDGRIADYALFAVPLGYDLVKEKFYNSIAARFAIKSAESSVYKVSFILRGNDEREQCARLGLTDKARLKQVQIISNAFNRIDNCSSFLNVIIADGRDAFKEQVTFIEIWRADNWPDSAILNVGAFILISKLPWNMMWSTQIVTEREVFLGNKIIEGMKPSYTLFYPGKSIVSLSSSEFLKRFLADIEKSSG